MPACDADAGVDSGTAGADAGVDPATDGGCCSTGGGRSTGLCGGIAVLIALRRRRRAR